MNKIGCRDAAILELCPGKVKREFPVKLIDQININLPLQDFKAIAPINGGIHDDKESAASGIKQPRRSRTESLLHSGGNQTRERENAK